MVCAVQFLFTELEIDRGTVMARVVATSEEILTFGYIKEWHKDNNIELPPNDLMILFVAWLKLLDSFDMNKIPSDIIFDPESPTRFQRVLNNATYSGVAGTIIVEKGMKYCWKFKIDHDIKYPQIAIMEDEIIKSLNEIRDNCDGIHKGYGLGIPHWCIYHANTIKRQLDFYTDQFEIEGNLC